jgi:reactive intermediate/imine deaminase
MGRKEDLIMRTVLSLVAAISILTLGWSCAAPPVEPGPPGPPSIKFISSPGSEGLDLPFSEAVQVGHMLYLSGQVGNLPGTTELVPGGIAEETRQTLDNISAILERNGSSLDRVVKCTVFLDDIEEWPAMNEVYRSYFTGEPPARSALAANGLAFGARVEIECIAVVGGE